MDGARPAPEEAPAWGVSPGAQPSPDGLPAQPIPDAQSIPGPPTGAPGRRIPRLHPSTALLLASGLATVVLISLIGMLPVPYAVIMAGPATDTLGSQHGTPLISIPSQTTYPTTGKLDLTTVRIHGGPGNDMSLWELARAWFDDGEAVWPRDRLFPPGQTAEQNKEENQQEMASSQEMATAAALRSLGHKVPEQVSVSSFLDGSPAKGTLAEGDVILSVNGTPTPDSTVLRSELQKVTPGKVAPMVVRRDGKEITISPRTARGEQGGTVLGVLVRPIFEEPFTVSIQLDNVGGPSAGTMFALGIIDKLTPGSLTGGRVIAGTGTIDADGAVGPIGGIQQKMIGARDAGAEVFLAPADNCSEVVGHEPDGLVVVRIETLAQAREALETLAEHPGAAGAVQGLPRCTR